jgi:hypothetical protein
VEDRKLWALIRALHDAELDHFGCRYADTEERELKAKRLLKTKVFRHAHGAEPFEHDNRRDLAKACLEDGKLALPVHHAALGQAKLAYVDKVLAIAREYECKAFASIVPKAAPRPTDDYLRRDYSFLLERFYRFLRTQLGKPQGIVVFDELERSQSHLLIGQMRRYFLETGKGKNRQRAVIPEPFFVHSHLTTGIHLADLVAYIISWGVRVGGMNAPAREELTGCAAAVELLRHDIARPGRQTVWAFNVLRDLRPRGARVAAAKEKAMPKEKAMRRRSATKPPI